MTESSIREQLLSLKVMRLTRPSFFPNATVPVDPSDSLLASLNLEHSNATEKNTNRLADSLGFSLVLPQSFENIYLGETFTCYVSIHNDSNLSVTDVSMKIDLQTSSQRVGLASKFQEPIGELPPEKCFGEVVSHEVKEVGQHILVCAVQYNAPGGEKMYFRKFFKFPVSKPLDVRTKFYNSESDEVYLEAQIQNTTHLPMVLEKVVLEPSDLYASVELNAVDGDQSSVSKTAKTEPILNYLNPQDTRQFLYCLNPKPGVPLKSFRGVTSIGKLDMIWRTSCGERGHLQTSQLQRMAPGYGDLRVTVERNPSVVDLQRVFEIVCRLHNNCDRALDLLLTLEGSLQPNLIWYSTSGQRVGEVSSNSYKDISLQLIPVAPGLHSISGIRLTDTFLKRTYEHDDLAQVFVTA